MSTHTPPRTPRSAPSPQAGQSTLAGTRTTLRFFIRRDRIRLSLWLLGIGALSFYFANAVQIIAEDEQELAQITTLFTDPVGRLMTGPAYGMDEPTHARFYAAGYVLFIYIMVALMSMFTVVRHTRLEEQTGRAELVRANVQGRHAPLTSALLLVLCANVVAGLLIVSGGLSAGYAAAGSLLVGTSATLVGMFFAGAAALTVQLSEAPRGASAMAGGLLGLAYLIRMGGDLAEQGGSALSWFSPLGWAQQTAPYVHDRWWPLLYLMVFTVGFVLLGYWLSTKRDVGASLMPTRLGRSRARPGLGTPLGIAYRVLRGGLRGWAIALVLAALMFGGYAESMLDAADTLPEEFAVMFSGDDMVLGYSAYMALFMAIFVAAAGVSGITQLRGEENRGRAEIILSAPVSRVVWLGAHLTVLLLGLTVMLVLVGLGSAVGTVTVLGGDGVDFFWDLILASLHQAPAVLAVMGLVTALFGWVPRIAGIFGWLMLGYAVLITNFGAMLELPELMHEANIFGHLAEYPVQPVDWSAVAVLVGIGVVGLAVGFAGWHRREVNTV